MHWHSVIATDAIAKRGHARTHSHTHHIVLPSNALHFVLRATRVRWSVTMSYETKETERGAFATDTIFGVPYVALSINRYRNNSDEAFVYELACYTFIFILRYNRYTSIACYILDMRAIYAKPSPDGWWWWYVIDGIKLFAMKFVINLIWHSVG